MVCALPSPIAREETITPISQRKPQAHTIVSGFSYDVQRKVSKKDRSALKQRKNGVKGHGEDINEEG